MMDRFKQSLLRLFSFFRRAQLDRDLEIEMSAHLELAIEENLRRGLSPAEARRQALLRFGGSQQAKEQHREARGLPFLETLLQDLRFAFRVLLKSPGFSAVSVLTLALGIGATTAIFSVVYATMLAPLPYHNPDQLVLVWSHFRGGDNDVSTQDYLDWKTQNKTFQEMIAWRSRPSATNF